jgi:hypothetical protein
MLAPPPFTIATTRSPRSPDLEVEEHANAGLRELFECVCRLDGFAAKQ